MLARQDQDNCRAAARGLAVAPGHTEETMMHHIISYYLAQARIADLRQHAERDTRAGSPSRDQVSGPRASGATEWPARHTATDHLGNEN